MSLPDFLRSVPEDDAEAIVRIAVERFGGGLTLACSFGGTGGMVLLDMAARAARDLSVPLDVFVLDTDFLFPETYALIDTAERRYGITVRRAKSLLTPEAQAAEHGEALWTRDPDACCELRKVEPMRRALRGYRAWMTALRRDQSDTRAATEIAAVDDKYGGIWKFCPLALWDEPRVLNYAFNHDIPNNPLLERGYTSLGCTHCTRPAASGRQGRWAGFDKIECGLHTPPTAATSPATLTVKGRPDVR